MDAGLTHTVQFLGTGNWQLVLKNQPKTSIFFTRVLVILQNGPSLKPVIPRQLPVIRVITPNIGNLQDENTCQ